jgi:large subunit ribosomal protein L29
MLKAKNLRDQSIEELEAILLDTKKELFTLKNEMKQSKKLEKPHLLSEKKNDIAKLLTVVREKQMDAVEEKIS